MKKSVRTAVIFTCLHAATANSGQSGRNMPIFSPDLPVFARMRLQSVENLAQLRRCDLSQFCRPYNAVSVNYNGER